MSRKCTHSYFLYPSHGVQRGSEYRSQYAAYSTAASNEYVSLRLQPSSCEIYLYYFSHIQGSSAQSQTGAPSATPSISSNDSVRQAVISDSPYECPIYSCRSSHHSSVRWTHFARDWLHLSVHSGDNYITQNYHQREQYPGVASGDYRGALNWHENMVREYMNNHRPPLPPQRVATIV